VERKYLPTFADLVDRLSIVLLKSVFIGEHRDAYLDEIATIEHDIDLLLDDMSISASDVRAILVLMLTNRFIWENEAKVRNGDRAIEMLRATHCINGVRNKAKNVLSAKIGERLDLKLDCLAADLPADMGNWRLFEDMMR
jgi:hypothetical protein